MRFLGFGKKTNEEGDLNREKIKLNFSEQDTHFISEALKAIINNKNIVVTGGHGAGKTTLATAIITLANRGFSPTTYPIFSLVGEGQEMLADLQASLNDFDFNQQKPDAIGIDEFVPQNYRDVCAVAELIHNTSPESKLVFIHQQNLNVQGYDEVDLTKLYPEEEFYTINLGPDERRVVFGGKQAHVSAQNFQNLLAIPEIVELVGDL